MLSDKKIKLIIRLVWIVLLFALLTCLLIKDIDFSKQHRIFYQAGKANTQTSSLVPANRTQVKEGVWQIIDEPVYFTTRMSTDYNQVKLRFKYQNNCCQNILVGLQAGNQEDFSLALLDNQSFNNLTWPQTKIGDLTIWSKDLLNKDEDTLLGEIAENKKLASYNLPEFKNIVLEGYQDYKNPVNFNIGLVGSYSFLTYINEELSLEFNLLNDSQVDYYIYDQAGYLIDRLESNNIDFSIFKDNLVSGIYKIVVIPQLDQTTISLASTNKYINFVGELELTSQPYSLLTNAGVVRLWANDFSGQQLVQVGEKEVAITNIKQKYYLQSLTRQTYLDIPQGNLKIYTDELISFNYDYLLVGKPNQMQYFSAESDYDYLVAKYNMPIKEGDWSVGELQFDVTAVNWQKGKLRFIISALGTTSENPLLLKDIEIIYKKTAESSWWQDIIFYFKYWFRTR